MLQEFLVTLLRSIQQPLEVQLVLPNLPIDSVLPSVHQLRQDLVLFFGVQRAFVEGDSAVLNFQRAKNLVSIVFRDAEPLFLILVYAAPTLLSQSLRADLPYDLREVAFHAHHVLVIASRELALLVRGLELVEDHLLLLLDLSLTRGGAALIVTLVRVRVRSASARSNSTARRRRPTPRAAGYANAFVNVRVVEGVVAWDGAPSVVVLLNFRHDWVVNLAERHVLALRQRTTTRILWSGRV